jgi:hypothetical protein
MFHAPFRLTVEHSGMSVMPSAERLAFCCKVPRELGDRGSYPLQSESTASAPASPTLSSTGEALQCRIDGWSATRDGETGCAGASRLAAAVGA